MNERTSTVHVEPTSQPNVIKMTWQRHVQERDVCLAFEKITSLLDKSSQPCYVIVDITHDPNFPIYTTIHNALVGPNRHPRLCAWLIIGSNRAARLIATTMTSVTRRSNIYWFNTEDEAITYIDSQVNLREAQ